MNENLKSEVNIIKSGYRWKDLYQYFNLSAIIYFGVFFLCLYAYKYHMPFFSNGWVSFYVIVGTYVTRILYSMKKIKSETISDYFSWGYYISVPIQLVYLFQTWGFFTEIGYDALFRLSVTLFFVGLLYMNANISMNEYKSIYENE